MRLNMIKLLSNYKLLKGNQIFSFGDASVQGISGINGSGKSILLELISQIFIEASNQNTKEYYVSKIGYEISYSLVRDYMINSVLQSIGGHWNDIEKIDVRILNYETVFKMWISNGIDEYEVNKSNNRYVFFPRKIVVYSSGHNESISNEIYNYKLYSMIERDNSLLRMNNEGEVINKTTLDMYNGLFYYINDKTSNLAILTTTLYNSIDKDDFCSFYNNLRLSSFSIRFDEFDVYKKKIVFDGKAQFILNEMRKFPHEKYANQNGSGFYRYLVDNTILKNKAPLLASFEGFQRLYDYNTSKVKNRILNKIIHNPEKNNESYIEWNIGNNRVFELLDMSFIRDDNQEMELGSFSDGEYQVLQIISLLQIFSGENILFLFDEPETHFNPSWKSLFVFKMKSTIDQGSQIVFTSHNPEVITDLRKNNVISLKEGNQNIIQFETFGANPNKISSNLFGKRNTVAELAKQKIDEYRCKINHAVDIKQLETLKEEIENTIGESSERLMLIIEIQKRMK